MDHQTSYSSSISDVSSIFEEEPSLPQDVFLTWKSDTLGMICKGLSERQRSAFIVDLLGRLPARNRLYLVRNIKKISTIDFIYELPDEISLSILQYLDPESIVIACQVSKYWNKLITSEIRIWKRTCTRLRINLPYHDPTLTASYYRHNTLSYLGHMTSLKQKTSGFKTRCVSDVTHKPAHASRTLALCANSVKVYSGGDDRFTRCWDRSTLTLINEREGMVASCVDCTDTIVAAGQFNGCISIYTTNITSLITTCSQHMGPVYDVKCTADNHFVVSASSDCTVRVWALSRGDVIATPASCPCYHVFRGHESMVNKIHLTPRLDRIFSLDISCIKVWDVEEKSKICELKPLTVGGKEGYFLPGLLAAPYLNPDSSKSDVIVCGSSNGVYIWDMTQYTLLRVIESKVYVCAETLIGVGTAFIAVTYDDGVALIRLSDGHHELTVPVPQYNNSSCGVWVNPECRWLDGQFQGQDDMLLSVTTLAGDICNLFINNNK